MSDEPEYEYRWVDEYKIPYPPVFQNKEDALEWASRHSTWRMKLMKRPIVKWEEA